MSGRARIGISGWRYAPWRGVFYPEGLPQRAELAYAASRMDTAEINGSFYSLQRPSSWQAWHDQVPEDFVFAVKGPRYITHMLKLHDAQAALANFLSSGVLALRAKLGPILWQLPPQLAFHAERMEPGGRTANAYALAFAGSGIAGLASCWYLWRCKEPAMTRSGPPAAMGTKLAAPFRDRPFRRLLIFLGAWNVASNFSGPFLTVYLIQQLGYGLSTVTGLWVLSQVANAVTLFMWGRVSDRLSNKAILSVALPVFFACMAALVFTRLGAPLGLQLALLALVHVVMGVASGGIGLATGNLGLKLARPGEGTSYLAAVGLVSATAGGIAPLVAGAWMEHLQSTQFSVLLRWVSDAASHEVSVVRLLHYEFVFVASALAGLYVMHALSRVEEGQEVSERRVMQELRMEAAQTVDQLSSIAGLLGGVFSFDRLSERRLWFRRRP